MSTDKNNLPLRKHHNKSENIFSLMKMKTEDTKLTLGYTIFREDTHTYPLSIREEKVHANKDILG